MEQGPVQLGGGTQPQQSRDKEKDAPRGHLKPTTAGFWGAEAD